MRFTINRHFIYSIFQDNLIKITHWMFVSKMIGLYKFILAMEVLYIVAEIIVVILGEVVELSGERIGLEILQVVKLSCKLITEMANGNCLLLFYN